MPEQIIKFDSRDYRCYSKYIKSRTGKEYLRVFCQQVKPTKPTLNQEFLKEAKKYDSGYDFKRQMELYYVSLGHTYPIASSLAQLFATNAVIRTEGLSKAKSVYPFYIQIKDPKTGKSIFLKKSSDIQDAARKYGMDLYKLWTIANPGRKDKVEFLAAWQRWPRLRRPPRAYYGTQYDFLKDTRNATERWYYKWDREEVTKPLSAKEIEQLLAAEPADSEERKRLSYALKEIQKRTLKVYQEYIKQTKQGVPS